MIKFHDHFVLIRPSIGRSVSQWANEPVSRWASELVSQWAGEPVSQWVS